MSRVSQPWRTRGLVMQSYIANATGKTIPEYSYYVLWIQDTNTHIVINIEYVVAHDHNLSYRF